LTFDYNEDEMMYASVADVKWNAPKIGYFHRLIRDATDDATRDALSGNLS